jgi:hypothetical protein
MKSLTDWRGKPHPAAERDKKLMIVSCLGIPIGGRQSPDALIGLADHVSAF